MLPVVGGFDLGSGLAGSCLDRLAPSPAFIMVARCGRRLPNRVVAATRRPAAPAGVCVLEPSGVIDEGLRGFNPGFLLVDKTPSGMGGELLTSLRRMKASGSPTRIVLGLRDVLDDPDRTANGGRRCIEVVEEGEAR